MRKGVERAVETEKGRERESRGIEARHEHVCVGGGGGWRKRGSGSKRTEQEKCIYLFIICNLYLGLEQHRKKVNFTFFLLVGIKCQPPAISTFKKD